MIATPLKDNPLVLEINARILLQRGWELAGGKVTLAEIPEALLSSWKGTGFDAVWIMGIWTTGEAGRRVSQRLTGGYADLLPDWTPEDAVGSPYAVQDYRVHREFGGDEALAALRERMAAHGLSLILDFVPNHTAPDHAWVDAHPELYVSGNEGLLASQPENYARHNELTLAYGRDPYFPGWADTFQLDYRRASTREAMVRTLLSVAERCDGVRCDMAMLVLSDVFVRTWGALDGEGFGEREFWADAIDQVRSTFPGFKFIAEAYWHLEERLQLLGFDYTYHKSLYDFVRDGEVTRAGASLASLDNVKRSLFFIENHDEPRAASAFPHEGHRRAAAFLSLSLPGMRLVHDGQMEGRKVHHSIHLGRRQEELPDAGEKAYYRRLFAALAKSCVGGGEWKLLEVRPAGAGIAASDRLIACLWDDHPDRRRNLVVVNLSSEPGEGHIPVKFFEVGGRNWILDDLLSDQVYQRSGSEMSGWPGLYVGLQPYETQIFDLKPAP